MKKTLSIGLTGGMGSGKSLVLNHLAKKGIPTLQTDKLGHQLLKSRRVSRILMKRFGKSILGKNKQINRSKLARIVFQHPNKQKALGKILHPLIRTGVITWVRAQKQKSNPAVVVEVPLLFENGFYRFFDGVLSISASSKTRFQRLLKRGWDPMEVRRREKFQWPQSQKNRKADWVIYNEGTPQKLFNDVDRWFEERKKEGIILVRSLAD